MPSVTTGVEGEHSRSLYPMFRQLLDLYRGIVLETQDLNYSYVEGELERLIRFVKPATLSYMSDIVWRASCCLFFLRFAQASPVM